MRLNFIVKLDIKKKANKVLFNINKINIQIKKEKNSNIYNKADLIIFLFINIISYY